MACLHGWNYHIQYSTNHSEQSTAAANAPTDLSISEDAVTFDEVRNAVKSIEMTAAGIYKTTADFLKFVCECMLRWLQVIINCAWISEGYLSSTQYYFGFLDFFKLCKAPKRGSSGNIKPA